MAVRTVHRVNPGDDIDAIVAVINQLAALCNELKTDFAALTAKLDADAGVTDANYTSTIAIAAASADTIVLGH